MNCLKKLRLSIVKSAKSENAVKSLGTVLTPKKVMVTVSLNSHDIDFTDEEGVITLTHFDTRMVKIDELHLDLIHQSPYLPDNDLM